MARINVTDDEGTLIGWFDDHKAQSWDEATRRDGNNHISRATGSEWAHERLYRTAGSRWVLHWWSRAQDRYRFVAEDEARTWLLAQEHDEAVTEIWGEIEDERGPGRPPVGPAIHLRLPLGLLERIDTAAAARGTTRAEAIRDLLTVAMAGNS